MIPRRGRVAENYTTTANNQYVTPTLLEGEVKSKHLVRYHILKVIRAKYSILSFI